MKLEIDYSEAMDLTIGLDREIETLKRRLTGGTSIPDELTEDLERMMGLSKKIEDLVKRY